MGKGTERFINKPSSSEAKDGRFGENGLERERAQVALAVQGIKIRSRQSTTAIICDKFETRSVCAGVEIEQRGREGGNRGAERERAKGWQTGSLRRRGRIEAQKGQIRRNNRSNGIIFIRGICSVNGEEDVVENEGDELDGGNVSVEENLALEIHSPRFGKEISRINSNKRS